MAYKFDPNDKTTNLSNNTFFISVGTIRKNIGDLGMKTLQILAYEGNSEEPELINAVRNVILFSTGKPVSEDSIRRSIQSLWSNGLIERKEVNTGVRRFNILKLLSNGKMFANHVFDKTPVESEWEELEREHARVEHGYLIKDTKKILEEKGVYDSITTGRTENRIRISDDRSCIPDIACTLGDGCDFYEVECGTHNQKDFDYKCDKLVRLTKILIFVSQNRYVLKKAITKQVEHWIGKVGREKLKALGRKVYLTTLKDLQNDKWTYIYDMTMDEPICCFGKKKGGES